MWNENRTMKRLTLCRCRHKPTHLCRVRRALIYWSSRTSRGGWGKTCTSSSVRLCTSKHSDVPHDVLLVYSLHFIVSVHVVYIQWVNLPYNVARADALIKSIVKLPERLNLSAITQQSNFIDNWKALRQCKPPTRLVVLGDYQLFHMVQAFPLVTVLPCMTCSILARFSTCVNFNARAGTFAVSKKVKKNTFLDLALNPDRP